MTDELTQLNLRTGEDMVEQMTLERDEAVALAKELEEQVAEASSLVELKRRPTLSGPTCVSSLWFRQVELMLGQLARQADALGEVALLLLLGLWLVLLLLLLLLPPTLILWWRQVAVADELDLDAAAVEDMLRLKTGDLVLQPQPDGTVGLVEAPPAFEALPDFELADAWEGPRCAAPSGLGHRGTEEMGGPVHAVATSSLWLRTGLSFGCKQMTDGGTASLACPHTLPLPAAACLRPAFVAGPRTGPKLPLLCALAEFRHARPTKEMT